MKRLFPLCLAAFLLPLAADAQGPAPKGVYEVVAVRAASDTPATLAQRQDPTLAAALGKTMTFGDRVEWFDGRFCGAPSVRPAAESIAIDREPNLSDLSAGPTLIIDCGGRAISSITPFVVVDQRVIAMRSANGTAWLVLEKPLAQADALALERNLARKGFDPGPVDGRIDSAARRAIGRFAKEAGAAFVFEQGVATEALVAAAAR